MTDATNEHEQAAIAELQRKVDALRGRPCGVCQAVTCGHESLFAIASGNPRQPLCLACLANVLGRSPRDLRDHLWHHFSRRDCYGAVWQVENLRERFPENSRPGCLWPADAVSVSGVDEASRRIPVDRSVSSPGPEIDNASELPGREWMPVAEWDAQEMACGDLVLELRLRLQSLSPGSLFRLVALDSGAREDIPAWCRLTGHRLLRSSHPEYWIQRKDR